MSRWASDPEGAADALVLGAIERLGLAGHCLAINQHGNLVAQLGRRSLALEVWNRRAGGKIVASAAPPPGAFDVALLRLPKVKAELEMAAHQALGMLRVGGTLYIYGGNDEGARTMAKRLAPLGVPIGTIAAEGHGRIVALVRPESVAGLKLSLEDWRQDGALDLGRGVRSWVSYPGLFADGALDAGTALLLAHLPSLPYGARVLDYGCGTGPIAAAIAARDPSAEIDLLDVDAVALHAARINVGRGRCILGSALGDVGPQTYHLIVSNPPLHIGIVEDHAVLHQLIAAAPAHLKAGGQLLMMVQRRIALDRVLGAAFKTVETIADDGRYRIWSAHDRAGRLSGSAAPCRSAGG